MAFCSNSVVCAALLLVASTFLAGYTITFSTNGKGRCAPGVDGGDFPRQKKNVTLVVENKLKQPPFTIQINLNTYSHYLIDMMEDAADLNDTFRFTVTYFNRKLGYYVNTINGVCGNNLLNNFFWCIKNSSLIAIECDVSHYIPANHETVLFNLTTPSICF
ncbi:uncharacterized protein LOC112564585 [Pomacea canaliculata]|uniref:uncharacterized protein LOC112564585 n=1 Tax=Pomacea canaliculata TaxID=400727 RepID=UPI000D734C7B|nr:uncharacterized protein LOC112564585 [Pomacea canaliculata]